MHIIHKTSKTIYIIGLHDQFYWVLWENFLIWTEMYAIRYLKSALTQHLKYKKCEKRFWLIMWIKRISKMTKNHILFCKTTYAWGNRISIQTNDNSILPGYSWIKVYGELAFFAGWIPCVYSYQSQELTFVTAYTVSSEKS